MIKAQTGTLVMKDENGRDSVILHALFGLLDLGGQGNEGDLRIRDSAGTFVFRFDATSASSPLAARVTKSTCGCGTSPTR